MLDVDGAAESPGVDFRSTARADDRRTKPPAVQVTHPAASELQGLDVPMRRSPRLPAMNGDLGTRWASETRRRLFESMYEVIGFTDRSSISG